MPMKPIRRLLRFLGRAAALEIDAPEKVNRTGDFAAVRLRFPM
jgi:hypothetical protein